MFLSRQKENGQHEAEMISPLISGRTLYVGISGRWDQVTYRDVKNISINSP